jgi:site-specific recombinase XerD
MPQVHYYLKKNRANDEKKKKTKADNKCLIYLQFKYNGNKLVYAFGQKIESKNWSLSQQRVKNNRATTEDGQYALNDLLDTLQKTCIKAYNTEIANGGIPSKERLKHYLDSIFYETSHDPSKPDLMCLFDRFIAGEIQNKGKDKSKSTLQNYTTSKNHLIAFAKHSRQKIDFDSINLDFFYKFSSFLKKEFRRQGGDIGLKHNTIVKTITVLKTVMAEGVDLGYTSNMQFKHKKFSLSEENTDSVYLSETDLLTLWKHDFTSNKKLDQVRDLFLVGCYTGLRYSDYSNIGPGNIVEMDGDMFIKMITQKTKEIVIIPCNPIVLSIFKKYESNANKLPKSISSQKFNDYIKDACKAAELKERGRLTSEPNTELWECVSSHTARRSFATNLYLDGFPSHEIMKITGHRSESSFKKYIKVDKLQTAKRLSDHIKKNWSSKIMKVAS